MYALHSIIIKKTVPLDEAVQKAKDISKKKKIYMRELVSTYHFRNIPKTKFIPKFFRSKKINKDITLVFGQLKPENSKLSGEGIFSDLFNYSVRKIGPRVISALVRKNEFNNVSTNTLNEYGNYTIKKLVIYRTPISNILNSALNLISLGKWNELRKKYGYDKLFHTALICDIGGKNIIVEKNEVVNISTSYKTSKDTQTHHIDMEGKSFTLNEMVMGCKSRMGDDKFFDYDAFQNNCQVFIKNMLQTVGLYSSEVDKFLFQDLSEIYKKLPGFTSKIAKLITRTGAFISRLRGDGGDEEEEKEPEKKEEDVPRRRRARTPPPRYQEDIGPILNDILSNYEMYDPNIIEEILGYLPRVSPEEESRRTREPPPAPKRRKKGGAINMEKIEDKKKMINSLKKINSLEPKKVLLAKFLLEQLGGLDSEYSQIVNPQILSYLQVINRLESSNGAVVRDTWDRLDESTRRNFWQYLLRPEIKTNIRVAYGRYQEEKKPEKDEVREPVQIIRTDIERRPVIEPVLESEERKEGEGKKRRKRKVGGFKDLYSNYKDIKRPIGIWTPPKL